MNSSERRRLQWQDPEYKKMMSDAHKGNAKAIKAYRFPSGESNPSKDEKSKEKIRQSKLGDKNGMYGKRPWNYKGGPKCVDCGCSVSSYKASRCRKCNALNSKGEKSVNWKGGQKRYVHSTGTADYRNWRLSVFTRDSFTCVSCGQVGGYLEAHHIKGWANYPEFRFDVSNGVALCKECHSKTDNYRGKKSL